MKKYAFVKENLDDITLDYFKMVANICMCSEITNIAPLGFSGDDFILFGRFIEASESKDGKWHMESMVTLRNYCGGLEMLVTDKKGNFLVHSNVDGMSQDEVVEELYREFLSVKHLVMKTTKRAFENWDVSKNAEFSEGFEILKAYYLELENKKRLAKENEHD